MNSRRAICHTCRAQSATHLARQWSVATIRHYSNGLRSQTLRLTASPRHIRSLDRRLPSYRSFSATRVSANDSQSIGIIGGGITGLSAAYFLTRKFPNFHITLYEKSDRLGGWMQSERERLPDGTGDVLFEYGPRTLRPGKDALITGLLIRELGLEDDVILIGKDSPAAFNRFLYYPDHLVLMPGPRPGNRFMNLLSSVWSVLTEPIFKGVLTGIWKEPSVEKRPSTMRDESVASFVTRRLGGVTGPVENILSAVLQGIYAGDVHTLSARMLFPTMWHMEEIGPNGSLMAARAELKHRQQQTQLVKMKTLFDSVREDGPKTADDAAEMFLKLGKSSVFTMKDGIGQIATRLEEVLRNEPNVTIRTNVDITKLKVKDFEPGGPLEVILYDNSASIEPESITHDSIISTTRASSLHSILEPVYSPNTALEEIVKKHDCVPVMVINLYYAEPNLVPVRGFGYLIPQSVPMEQNPERALGVVFGSETSEGQHNVSQPGTTLTVMMGGHWWKEPIQYEDGDFPSESDAIDMARNVLERHLKISKKDHTPLVATARLQKDAIPQYKPGMVDDILSLLSELETGYNSRLDVGGASYHGVSVNDCIRVGWLAAANRDANGKQTSSLLHDIYEGHNVRLVNHGQESGEEWLDDYVRRQLIEKRSKKTAS